MMLFVIVAACHVVTGQALSRLTMRSDEGTCRMENLRGRLRFSCNETSVSLNDFVGGATLSTRVEQLEASVADLHTKVERINAQLERLINYIVPSPPAQPPPSPPPPSPPPPPPPPPSPPPPSPPLPLHPWKSCSDGAGGSYSNGIYRILPAGTSSPVNVYCDFTSDGGGWTKVLQYNNYYTPTASAVGDIAVASISANAKLSDAQIVAIAGPRPVWRFVDEGAVAGGSSVSRLYLQQTGGFSDVLQYWGFARQAYQWCMSSALSSCSWASRSSGMDLGANDCNRWFVDYSGNPHCYGVDSGGSREAAPSGTRCFAHGSASCDGRGDHTSRVNVALWVR